MKVITTGLLNRFWTKGIKPWLDKRIKSYADLMVTTASGYTPDALAVKEGFTELNGKLSTTNNVFGVNTSIGISIISSNCALCINDIYYIDTFIQLTQTVPENGTLFYIVKNDSTIIFDHRMDVCLVDPINNKTYAAVLLKNSNVFISNGTPIPIGVYKVTMIVKMVN